MQFRPSLNQPLLPFGQFSGQKLNRINAKYGSARLIVRMKMRHMVLRFRFREHPDDDPEEPADFRHFVSSVAHTPRPHCPLRIVNLVKQFGSGPALRHTESLKTYKSYQLTVL